LNSPRFLDAVDLVRQGGLAYCRARNLPTFAFDFDRIVSDPALGGRIAAAYLAGPQWDWAALPAYREFRDETAAQFDFLTRPTSRNGLGIEVGTAPRDPYPDAAAMMLDLHDHRRLLVYSTAACGNGHPFLSDDENDMFRAVHDAFGHAAIGRGFDRHGEEAAWCKHATMYSALGRRALATETRGQTCTLIYQGTRFPEQKMMLLPMEFWHFQHVSLRAWRPAR
jgi:hypothetical protein